jgi:hypothetical protein
MSVRPTSKIGTLYLQAFPPPEASTLTHCPLLPRCAVVIKHAIGEEVGRLRAAGMKGVHRIRVKGKDYDIDLDTYKTNRDACELLKHFMDTPFP